MIVDSEKPEKPKHRDAQLFDQEIVDATHELSRLGALSVENVDVFCEKGVFGVAQSRRILEAGQRVGLRVNFHAEELSCLGGAEVSKRATQLGISLFCLPLSGGHAPTLFTGYVNNMAPTGDILYHACLGYY